MLVVCARRRPLPTPLRCCVPVPASATTHACATCLVAVGRETTGLGDLALVEPLAVSVARRLCDCVCATGGALVPSLLRRRLGKLVEPRGVPVTITGAREDALLLLLPAGCSTLTTVAAPGERTNRVWPRFKDGTVLSWLPARVTSVSDAVLRRICPVVSHAPCLLLSMLLRGTSMNDTCGCEARCRCAVEASGSPASGSDRRTPALFLLARGTRIGTRLVARSLSQSAPLEPLEPWFLAVPLPVEPSAAARLGVERARRTALPKLSRCCRERSLWLPSLRRGDVFGARGARCFKMTALLLLEVLGACKKQAWCVGGARKFGEGQWKPSAGVGKMASDSQREVQRRRPGYSPLVHGKKQPTGTRKERRSRQRQRKYGRGYLRTDVGTYR